MSNPFSKSLDEFRGRHVRAVSNDGREFEGFVERLHHHDRHVVLRGAADADGNRVGRVLLSHVDVLETTDPTERVERLALDGIQPAPYHAREFDAAENRGYIDRVRNDGWVGSFPTVRPAAADGDLKHPGDAGFEIVAGHKRLWVAAEAGLDSHPVQIVDIDAWTAATRFVADHLPAESNLRGNGESQEGYYAREEIAAAVDALVERWGERALDLDRVTFNVARLGLQDAVDDSRDPDDTSASSAAPGATAAASASEDERDQTVACDVEGCGYTGTERGLSIHQTRAHGGDAGEPPTPEQIKALRAARGWTQSDLAEKLGVGNSAVANWEAAYNPPGDAYAAQLWALREETFDDSDGDGTRGSPDTDAQSGGDGEQAVDEDEGYPCPDCGATFDSERGRSIHRGHKHGNDGPEEASDGERRDPDQTPPDTSALGTGELASAARALDEERWSEMSAASPNGQADTADIQTQGFASDEDDEDDDHIYYPRTCSCGVVCGNSLERAIHRTEAHRVPRSELGSLQPGEFKTLIAQSDTVPELADALGWSCERTLRVLGIYGFEDAITGGNLPDDPAASEDLLRLGPEASEGVSDSA